MSHRILDIRGLAGLDDGRINLPENNGEQDMELTQAQLDTDDSLEGYSPEQLLRLYDQFSHTERVQKELHQRYCNGTLGVITPPQKLINEWRQYGML